MSCEPGMCWAESLAETYDYWKQETATARAERDASYAAQKTLREENERLKAEIRTWKQRLVDEQARLRAQIQEDRENAAENCAIAIDECCHGIDDVCVASGCQMGIPGAGRHG